MPVTMHDVAQLAGVSVKTVSNVVNGYPHLRPATKERVEAAIAELGYQLNVSARNLRQGRTGMIGLAVPELSQPYFAELADMVIQEGEERGVTVLIEQTGAERDRELEVLHGTRRRMTDGLIFSPLALGEEDRAELSVDYPLVLLGERIFAGPTDHVTMANAEGGYAATTYLLERGRRRIAVIGSHPGEGLGSAMLRVEGYERALADAGIAPSTLTCSCPSTRGTGRPGRPRRSACWPPAPGSTRSSPSTTRWPWERSGRWPPGGSVCRRMSPSSGSTTSTTPATPHPR